METLQKTMDAVQVLRRLNRQDRDQQSQSRRSTETAKPAPPRVEQEGVCEKERCTITPREE
jgi:hypothetical protein